MTIRFDSPLQPSTIQFGVNGLGVLGSQVPSTGTHGASILYPQLDLPTENNDEFSAWLITQPAGLTTFELGEDGSLTVDGPSGIYRGTFETKKNGQSVGFASFTTILGAPTSGILRDLNQSFSGKRLCTTGQAGAVASSIPSTGTDGPPIAYPHLTLPADNDKLVRVFITSFPSAGTLTVYDDSSFIFSGAPDGSYTASYQVYFDDILTDTGTLDLDVGNPTAEIIITLSDISFDLQAGNYVAGEATLSTVTSDTVFAGSANQNVVTSFSIATDEVYTNLSASVSPVLVANIVLSDVTTNFSGGVGGATVAAILLDSSIFTGSVSGTDQGGGIINASMVTENTIFTGVAFSSVPTSSIATIDAATDASIFTGSADTNIPTAPVIAFNVLTDDSLISGSVLGYTGGSPEPAAVMGITLEDSVFLGSFTGSLTTECFLVGNLDDVTPLVSATSTSATASIGAITSDVSVNITAASGVALTSLMGITDDCVFAGSAVSSEQGGGGELVVAEMDVQLSNINMNVSAFGSIPPAGLSDSTKLPISLGVTLEGKLIILM